MSAPMVSPNTRLTCYLPKSGAAPLLVLCLLACGCGGQAVSPRPDATTCGNGVLDEGEECDDGLANSDWEPDVCRTSCRLPRCGDLVTDNAIHLTATAFSTGPYTIRVRSQGGAYSEVGSKGFWHWNLGHEEVGAPYTLNINLGLAPNKPRPHWQYLQPGQRWASLECTSALQ